MTGPPSLEDSPSPGEQTLSFGSARFQTLVIVLGLIALTLGALGGVARCGFVNFDDNEYVYNNRHVQNGLTADGARWAFSTNFQGNYQPLVLLSYMVDREFWGPAPRGFHLTSLALHVVNVLLLFLVLQKLTSSRWRSAVVAAIFAIHPLRVESVAWISERKDVLAMFFGLLAVAAYASYARRPRTIGYGLVLVLFAASLLCKALFVTFPALLLLLDFWPLRRGRKWGALVLEKVPLFLMAGAFSALTFILQRTDGAVMSIARLSIADRMINALLAYFRYLGMIVWPARLAVFYPRHTGDWPMVAVAASVMLLIAITILVLWLRREQPWLAVGWFWFLGTMVPMIGLVQVGNQALADRYTYLPAIGLLIAVGWAIPQAIVESRRGLTVLAFCAIAVLVPLALTTQRQVTYWTDSQTLWQHAMEVTGPNPRAMTNLAVDDLDRGDHDEARALLDRVLTEKPTDAVANNAYGALLAREGYHIEAIAHYAIAAVSDPNYELAHRNLGTQLSLVGRADDAIVQFRRAVQLADDDPVAHWLLGIELSRKGQVSAALKHFEAGARLDPNNAQMQLSLGRALTETGQVRQGLLHLDEALRLDSGCSDADYFAALALARQGNFDEAARRLRACLAISPADAPARQALRQVMRSLSRSASAGS